MNRITRLGAATTAALAAGAPDPLVATLLTIQHRGRLKRLFRLFAVRFLEAYSDARQHPASRHAARRMRRSKATLDLVRARLRSLGEDRPTDATLLDWARESEGLRIVHFQKAA